MEGMQARHAQEQAEQEEMVKNDVYVLEMLKEVKSEARAERESEVARLKGVADKEIKNAKEAAAAKVHTMQKRADEKLAFAQKKLKASDAKVLASEEIAKAKLEKLATLWVAREKQFYKEVSNAMGEAMVKQAYKKMPPPAPGRMNHVRRSRASSRPLPNRGEGTDISF